MKFTFENFLKNNISPELVIIYPGRFQPAHKNHAKAYNYLIQHFPYATVYVATSNSINPPRSPFSFSEKKIMLEAAGIPSKAIIQTTNPYVAKEITKNHNPLTTKLIFAVGGKDMLADKPRFNFLPTKKGNAYFKPLANIKSITIDDVNQLESFNSHGYVATVPTFKFNINIVGNKIPIKGASEIRELYKTASELGKKDIISQLYGTYSEKIYNLFNNKLI